MGEIVIYVYHCQIHFKSLCKSYLFKSIAVAALSLTLYGCKSTPDMETVLAVSLSPQHELTIRNTPTLALSPSGDLLVYRADNGDEDNRRLYIHSLIENQGRILKGTIEAETPFFSPDGTKIGFFADGKLKTITIDDGEIEVLSDAMNATGGYWDQTNNITYAAGAIWQVPAAGGEKRQLNYFEGNEQYSWPSVLPDGKHVMYNRANQEKQATSIIIENINTHEQWTVIENGSYPRYLDRGYLFFSDNGNLKLAKIDLDKKIILSTPRIILPGVLTSPSTGAAQFALSESGRLVYVPGTIFGKSRRLVTMDTMGNEHDSGLPRDRYSYVKQSPDGKYLAIEIEGVVPGIWLYDIENENLSELVSNGTYPVWSPDGNKIAFSRITSDRSGIHQVDIRKPHEIRNIVEDDYPIDHSFAWSPDDRIFAYTELNPATGMDLLMVPQPGSGIPRHLIVTNFNECCPTFSPDGKWLAYVSDVTGRPEVHIASFPGLEETHQISTGGAREPVWSHRDNILYYWVERQMKMVDLRRIVDFNNLEPVKLFEGVFVSSNSTWRSRYDVAPDGDGFVLLRRGAEETGITELMQVTDIFELFTR